MYTPPALAKRRLRWLLLGFSIALVLPVYLLLEKVYTQLGNESYYALRSQAEILVERIEQQLLSQIDQEQRRPTAEYSFFNILENPLLQTATVNFSPLSRFPPESTVPGLIGYFQIDPDGSLHTPVLPEMDNIRQARLSQRELRKRMAFRDTLREMLAVREKAKNDAVLIEDKSTAGHGRKENREQSPVPLQLHSKETRQKNILQSAESGKADMAARDEKKQVLSEEKLRELKIDAGRWTKKQAVEEAQQYRQRKARSAAQYQSRKEIVNLPGQSLLGALFSRAQQPRASKPMRESMQQQDSVAELSRDTVPGGTEKKEKTVFRFESEVGPLQMQMLDGGRLCFYRRVWHDHAQYVQGFIVEARDFFAAAIEPLLHSERIPLFSSVLLAHHGELLEQFKITATQHETLLYRSSLLPPLQAVELIVNSGPIDAGPGAVVVDVLAILLAVVLIFGLLLFYRLAAGQIDLAGQQRNFIAAVSHELKTPLTSIRMYGEMLRSGWVTDEVKKKTYYDYIFLESERLSRLIANVLQLARLDNHRQRPKLVWHDPWELLQQTREKVAVQCEAAGFQLHVIAAGQEFGGAGVMVDADVFLQIMINLIDNAIKFSRQNQRKKIDIGLKISTGGREALFTVRDYGPGIDNRQMKKIFRLFYRAGNELTRSKPGTGIGLALVVQLAKSMDARIDVSNRRPGAEFQLKLKMRQRG